MCVACIWVCASAHPSVALYAFGQIRDLVPESRAYMDLLAFEQKLDATIMRKRLEIQEGMKKPIKVSRSTEGA